jgi:hypothetical protein
MGWTEVATGLGTQAFLAGLKAVEGKVSKRRFKRLLATTVAQVLELHPDLGVKKARRCAEKVTGVAPFKKLMNGKKPAGLREGAEAAAAALIAGGAVKAAKAVASNRKRSAPHPARRRRPAAGAPESPGSQAAAEGPSVSTQ